jgi:hypothetical protein
MRTFVVYEVWTRSTVVIANSTEAAYQAGEPKQIKAEDGYALNLCNWHVVEVPRIKKAKKRL